MNYSQSELHVTTFHRDGPPTSVTVHESRPIRAAKRGCDHKKCKDCGKCPRMSCPNHGCTCGWPS